MKVFPSIYAFYQADRARLRSSEVDFGIWWKKEGSRFNHRVAWLRITGEVFAVEMGYGGEVEVLGVIAPGDETVIQEVMSGWMREMRDPDGIEWIREQISEVCPEGICNGSRMDGEHMCLCNPRTAANRTQAYNDQALRKIGNLPADDEAQPSLI